MQPSNNKIPFGRKDGTLVDVHSVPRGLACGCVCPACGRKLQANKGDRRSHYFSHDPSYKPGECKSAFETAIHLMAKQILTEERRAEFPALPVSVSATDLAGRRYEKTAEVEPQSRKHFDSVRTEPRLDDVRPDIVAYQGDTPYLIEVYVTHATGSEKRKKIRAHGLAAIEIDLSRLDYTTTKGEVREQVVEKMNNKTWLFHPGEAEVERRLRTALDEEMTAINRDIERKREAKARTSQQSPRGQWIHALEPAQTSGTRWLVCESCRQVFEISSKDAPYTLKSVSCPECGHAVSTRLCM